jgi:hypothetical protein
MQSSANQIEEAESITEHSTTPINPRFRSNQIAKIGKDIATHLMQSAIEPESAFAPKVERIGDLRISETNSRGAAAFAAEMDANHTFISHDSAIRRKLPTKINVFEPTIEWQVLVKSQAM